MFSVFFTLWNWCFMLCCFVYEITIVLVLEIVEAILHGNTGNDRIECKTFQI